MAIRPPGKLQSVVIDGLVVATPGGRMRWSGGEGTTSSTLSAITPKLMHATNPPKIKPHGNGSKSIAPTWRAATRGSVVPAARRSDPSLATLRHILRALARFQVDFLPPAAAMILPAAADGPAASRAPPAAHHVGPYPGNALAFLDKRPWANRHLANIHLLEAISQAALLSQMQHFIAVWGIIGLLAACELHEDICVYRKLRLLCFASVLLPASPRNVAAVIQFL